MAAAAVGGTLAPAGDEPPSSSSGVWQNISFLLGWGYFFAWSASFYPQVILNHQRRSVKGLSLDFLYLNLWGFTCYTVFNAAFYFSAAVRDEYRDRYGGGGDDAGDTLVQLNDVGFGAHAWALCAVTVWQSWVYARAPGQRVAGWVKAYVAGTAGVAAVWAVSVAMSPSGGKAAAGAGRGWLDLLYYLSFVKMGVTLIKYVPQAMLNFKRRSTTGWSIHNILLDLSGGAMSFAQQFVDSQLATGDWTSGMRGNPVKFGLAVVSVGFDVLFMWQHYVLFPDGGGGGGGGGARGGNPARGAAAAATAAGRVGDEESGVDRGGGAAAEDAEALLDAADRRA
ncbi:PQ loop repeat-domain-containing protein [Zopfochytrium polystomum]|nr:PQ loop repeat-domain-containing protein [Zopfochytrium polystomum]